MSNEEQGRKIPSPGLLDRFTRAMRLLRLQERRVLGEISRRTLREQTEAIKKDENPQNTPIQE